VRNTFTILMTLIGLAVSGLPAATLAPISAAAAAELEKKAANGDQAAQLELGIRHTTGNGVRTNLLKGYKWLRPLADQNTTAQRYVAEMLLDGGGTKKDPAEGLRRLTSAAESGDADAQSLMAKIHYQGNGVPKNQALAVQWLKRAADRGNADAQSMLGTLLANGEGVTKDSKGARVAWEKAAAQNDAAAMYNLGMLYYGPDLGPPDNEQAFKWWLRAAKAGHAQAQFHVGEMLRTGPGVKEDFREAVKWYQQAAAGRNEDAEHLLGKLHATGRGVPRDFSRTLALFEAAARDGHIEAQRDFAVLLLSGENDTPADPIRGLAWMMCAARQGFPAAMNGLGILYQEGTAAPKDGMEGLKWFYLAEQHGSREAMVNRSVAEVLLDPPEVAEAKRRRDAFKVLSGRKMTVDDSAPVTVHLFEWFRIPVLIAGKTNYLVADTAAGLSMLHQRHRARFGEPMALVQLHALTPEPFFQEVFDGQEMFVGWRPFVPGTVAFEDFSRFKKRGGMEFDGVFGLNCMRDQVVTFDGTASTFSIGGPPPEAALRQGTAVPLEDQDGLVAIPAALPAAQSISLLVDSGAGCFVTLNAADWRKAFPEPPKRTWTNEAWGGGGQSIGVTNARLQSIVIGGQAYSNVVVSTGPERKSAVGQEFLRRHIATFDFPNQVLYLRPSVHFSKPVLVNTSGLGIIRTSKSAQIFSVARKSPAYRAGIRDRDELLAVNGTSVARLEPWEILQLVNAQSGMEATLEIRRNGKPRKFTFRVNLEHEL
jgi:TPR repeat protein